MKLFDTIGLTWPFSPVGERSCGVRNLRVHSWLHVDLAVRPVCADVCTEGEGGQPIATSLCERRLFSLPLTALRARVCVKYKFSLC